MPRRRETSRLWELESLGDAIARLDDDCRTEDLDDIAEGVGVIPLPSRSRTRRERASARYSELDVSSASRRGGGGGAMSYRLQADALEDEQEYLAERERARRARQGPTRTQGYHVDTLHASDWQAQSIQHASASHISASAIEPCEGRSLSQSGLDLPTAAAAAAPPPPPGAGFQDSTSAASAPPQAAVTPVEPVELPAKTFVKEATPRAATPQASPSTGPGATPPARATPQADMDALLPSVLKAGEDLLLGQVRRAHEAKNASALKVEELKGRVRELELSNRSLETRLSTVTSALTEKTMECTKAATAAAEVPELQAKVAGLEAAGRTHHASLADTEALVARLRGKTKDLAQELEAVRREEARKAARVKNEHLDAVQATKRDYEGRLKQAATKLSGATARNATLVEQLAAARAGAEAKGRDLAKAQEDMPQFARKIKDLTDCVGGLEKEKHEAAARSIDRTKALELERSQFEQKFELQELKLATFEAKAKELEALLVESKRTSEAWKTKAGKYKAKIHGLEAAHAEQEEVVERKRKECLNLNTQLAAFRVEAARFETQLSGLRQETHHASTSASDTLSKLAAATQRGQDLELAVEKLELAQRLLKDHNARLEKERGALEEKCAKQEVSVHTLQEEVAGMSSQVRRFKDIADTDRAKLARKASDVEHALDVERQRTCDAEERIARYKEESERYKEMAATEEAARRQAADDLHDAQQRVAEVEALEALLEAERENAARLLEQNAVLQAAFDRLDRQALAGVDPVERRPAARPPPVRADASLASLDASAITAPHGLPSPAASSNSDESKRIMNTPLPADTTCYEACPPPTADRPTAPLHSALSADASAAAAADADLLTVSTGLATLPGPPSSEAFRVRVRAAARPTAGASRTWEEEEEEEEEVEDGSASALDHAAAYLNAVPRAAPRIVPGSGTAPSAASASTRPGSVRHHAGSPEGGGDETFASSRSGSDYMSQVVQENLELLRGYEGMYGDRAKAVSAELQALMDDMQLNSAEIAELRAGMQDVEYPKVRTLRKTARQAA